jgi:hypothetical protein
MYCLVTDDGKRELFPTGVGCALQRRGRADRGRDAGPGEGGQASSGVRRSRVEAQAARHRRRRLLGDLPLLPPIAAVVDTKTCNVPKSTPRRRGQLNAHLKTDYDYCARGVRRVHCRPPPFRTCSLSRESDTPRLGTAAGARPNKKISGFHTLPVKMYENIREKV